MIFPSSTCVADQSEQAGERHSAQQCSQVYRILISIKIPELIYDSSLKLVHFVSVM